MLYRCEAHQYVLAGAKAQLVARLAVLPTHHLVTALHACFPYVRIPALREIPLAVLARLHPVPAAYLKQLAEDTDLFGELPLNVQQQVRVLRSTSTCCEAQSLRHVHLLRCRIHQLRAENKDLPMVAVEVQRPRGCALDGLFLDLQFWQTLGTAAGVVGRFCAAAFS